MLLQRGDKIENSVKSLRVPVDSDNVIVNSQVTISIDC